MFPGFDAAIVLWGAVVLAYAAIRHFYFGGTCIQIDLPPRRDGEGPVSADGRN